MPCFIFCDTSARFPRNQAYIAILCFIFLDSFNVLEIIFHSIFRDYHRNRNYFHSWSFDLHKSIQNNKSKNTNLTNTYDLKNGKLCSSKSCNLHVGVAPWSFCQLLTPKVVNTDPDFGWGARFWNWKSHPCGKIYHFGPEGKLELGILRDASPFPLFLSLFDGLRCWYGWAFFDSLMWWTSQEKQKCFRQICPAVSHIFFLRDVPAGHPRFVWLLVLPLNYWGTLALSPRVKHWCFRHSAERFLSAAELHPC